MRRKEAALRLPTGADRRALLLVWLLIALYSAVFIVLSLRQAAAFEAGAADLGNMDQAVWQTLHHGLPADSSSGELAPRLSGHVEPVFYLLAVPYALHQAVSTLLVIQTIVIALGALPAYWLARAVLSSRAAGVAFAFAYLLMPSLQAANLTEFHPVALVSSLFLFAFYYLQQGSFAPFAVFALLATACKEDMSLLLVMLGGYALLRAWRAPARPPCRREPARRAWAMVGMATVAAGLAWFLATVYIIMPSFSAGEGNVLFQRYAEVGGSPQGLLRTLLSNPTAVAGALLSAERVQYLVGLLASLGFLTLAAPWALILAAPTLGINMLSNYPPMYSGISHYSAPVVPFLLIGAVYGAHSLAGFMQRRLRLSGGRALLLVGGWLLLSALLYQGVQGFTPLSLRYRMPVVTDHHRLLARFAAQIPPDAKVSAQPPLHPNVSSRAIIYPFPVVNDADYVLLDVTARPTMHPNDLQDSIQRLLQSGFGVLDAADGYLLLQRGLARRDLPDEFYSAFRAAGASGNPVDVDFGDYLQLTGYDIWNVDEGRQPWTTARFYFRVKQAPPSDLRIYPYYLDSSGQVIEDTNRRPLVAALWYRPAQWQVGETIAVQTLPWQVGDRYRLAVAVLRGNDWGNVAARLPARPAAGPAMPLALDGGTAVDLGSFRRALIGLAPQRLTRPVEVVNTDFGGQLRLLGYDLKREGDALRVTLYWQALRRPDMEYHTFVHLYGDGGQIAAQSDGVTGAGYPLADWQAGQALAETHTITLPAGGRTSSALTVGLYRLDTGERLKASGRLVSAAGDAVLLPIR